MFSYGNNLDADSNIYQKNNNKKTVEEIKQSIYEINKTVFIYITHT